MRTGIGYDIHRLIPSIKQSFIKLGGVEIICYYRLDAHSDGDVLLHSLTDACLGALALGDIGQWFPDSKDENKNRPSSDFLKTVVQEIHRLGWEIHQTDSIVILEEPKISIHADNIRRSIANILQIELSAVSVKAKSAEGMGAIGHRKAIACQAVVTLKERLK